MLAQFCRKSGTGKGSLVPFWGIIPMPGFCPVHIRIFTWHTLCILLQVAFDSGTLILKLHQAPLFSISILDFLLQGDTNLAGRFATSHLEALCSVCYKFLFIRYNHLWLCSSRTITGSNLKAISGHIRRYWGSYLTYEFCGSSSTY